MTLLKLILFLPFLVAINTWAYGQIIPEEFYNQITIYDNQSSNAELTISTNKLVYKDGELINMVGQVTNYFPGARVFVHMIDPSGNTLTTLNAGVGESGLLQLVINMPDDAPPGTYTLSAKYGEQGTSVNLQITKEGTTDLIVIPIGANGQDAGLTYVPNIFTIAAGKKITWINSDKVAHTVVSGTKAQNRMIPTGDFDSGSFGAGETFTLLLKEGEYDYYCKLHPWLVGSLIILPSSTPVEIEPEPSGEFEYTSLNKDDNVGAWSQTECSGCINDISIASDGTHKSVVKLSSQGSQSANGTRSTFSLGFEPQDTTSFEFLVMSIKTDGSSDHDSQIGLVDSFDNTRILYHFNSKSYSVWSDLKITLGEFVSEDSGFDPSSVTKLVVRTPEGELMRTRQISVLLDDVKLAKPVSVAQVEDNSLQIGVVSNIEAQEPLTILSDDNISRWLSSIGKGADSDVANLSDVSDAKEGQNSTQITIDNPRNYVALSHDYGGSLQNWSNYNYLEFWFKGQGTTKPIDLHLRDSKWRTLGKYTIRDDFVDWKKLVIPLHSNYHSLNKVRGVELIFTEGTYGQFGIDSIRLLRNIDTTPSILADDNISSWMNRLIITGDNDTAKSSDVLEAKEGINSALLTIENPRGYVALGHDYGESYQDWSSYNYMEFWFKGQNTTKQIDIHLRDNEWRFLGKYIIRDDAAGWKKVLVPLQSAYQQLHKVRGIEFLFAEGLHGQFGIDSIRLLHNVVAPTISDEEAFVEGQVVFVNGSVNKREPGQPLTIQLYNPQGNLVLVDQIMPDLDNNFIFQIPAKGEQFKTEGLYKITAQYGAKKFTDETTFLILTPILSEQAYKGFDIYTVGRVFYAIPYLEGDFEIKRIKSAQYSLIFSGTSLGDIKGIIDGGPYAGPYLIDEYNGYELLMYGGTYYAVLKEFGYSVSRVVSNDVQYKANSIEELKSVIDNPPQVILPQTEPETPPVQEPEVTAPPLPDIVEIPPAEDKNQIDSVRIFVVVVVMIAAGVIGFRAIQIRKSSKKTV